MLNAGPESNRRTGAVAAEPGRRRRPLWLFLLLLLVVLLLLAWLLYALLHKTDSDNAVAIKPLATAVAGVSPGTTASPPSSSGASSPARAAPNAVGEPKVFGAALIGGGGLASRPATGTEAAPGSTAAAAGATSSTGPNLSAVSGPQGTVLFASDSAALDANARSVIAAAATRIKALMPDSVTVTGYTDVVGGRPANTNLSQQRADAVAEVLRQALGASPAVTATAKGEADPIAPNTTRAGRQQNRRVSIATS
jgi:outer membrane protein OmpA-like peptidoglycan-associated protein